MKKMRQIFMVLFCMFFTVSTFATGVTQDNAAKVAKNYFSEVLISSGKNFPAVISASFEITKDENPVLYVFNFEKGGYVIVSAEDRFTPILGYSPDGYYDQNNMPDGFEFLMKDFSDMIAFIRTNNILGEPQYAAKWERYISDSYMPQRGAAAVVVGPLTALWNQDAPYNFYCPPVSDGPGGKGYAGCVATAMSIIMYYWRWPWEGVGNNGKDGYVPQKCNGVLMDTIKVNFEEAYYDYNGMWGTPTINADGYLYEPLALLQYHVGVSVNMNYCGNAAGGSGAQSTKVANAMKSFFKYDSSIKYVTRKSYGTGQAGTEAWTTMMKEQLDLFQPVYVSGYTATAGHAFVCDGYNSENMFHYNFGWSGSTNGYFVSDAPSEYTKDVAAVINFIPDRAQGYPINANNTWTVSHLKGTISDCSGPTDNYSSGTTSKWLINPAVVGNVVNNITITSIEMDLASGDYLRIYDGADENATLLGEFTGKTLFDPITSTASKVLVKFTSTNSSATAKGFMITYEAESAEFCDPRNPITLTESIGRFTDGSPEDMNYSNGMSCTWNIVPKYATSETEMHIKFFRIDTEEGKDVITIVDQNAMKVIAKLSGKYAENELPEYRVKSTNVKVTFTSNTYIIGKGFDMGYSIDGDVGIIKLDNINNLAVYPNPVEDNLVVQFNAETADNYNITICNMMGQVLYQETLNNFAGEYKNSLNFSSFAKGVYMLQVKSSKGMTTRKIVK